MHSACPAGKEINMLSGGQGPCIDACWDPEVIQHDIKPAKCYGYYKSIHFYAHNHQRDYVRVPEDPKYFTMDRLQFSHPYFNSFITPSGMVTI